jgi:hypothetical protein
MCYYLNVQSQGQRVNTDKYRGEKKTFEIFPCEQGEEMATSKTGE